MMVPRLVELVRTVPRAEWPGIVATAAVAVVVEVGIRTMPLPRLAALLGVRLAAGPGATDRPDGSADPADLARLRTARRVMRHWPWGNTCLRHALVMGHRVRHLQPLLCIGVAKRDGEVRAHAWLLIDGAVHDPIGGAAGYRILGLSGRADRP